MSEANMGQPPNQPPVDAASEADDDISWEDALEDLEIQKRMIKEQQQASATPTPPASATPTPPASATPTPPASATPTPPAQEAVAPVASTAVEEDVHNLQFILDLPLQVTVELGRKRLLIHDLLQLSQGSVIELTKQLGEPFEVLVNQKLIARGEVVVINDKFGVRITDIISPLERVHQL